jgi:hypothetical protein
MDNDLAPDDEEIREQRSWSFALRLLWSALIVCLVLGALAGITLGFGWQRYLLLCLVGLLAGAALALATLGSARGREVTGLVLGAVTLPLLAIYLGGIAVTDPGSYAAYSNSLAPFLLYATGAILGCLWISRLWSRESRRKDDQSPAAPEGSES